MRLLKYLHAPIYARRLEVLSDLIVRDLVAGDRVLDIGCGSGLLGARVRDHAGCPDRVVVTGCEKHPRGGEPIPIIASDGYTIPVPDAAFDVSILADVVHHEPEPERLVREVVRVTKRLLIVKDHTPRGILGYARTCFMDWAANSPYGVPCLYRYMSQDEWQGVYARHGLSIRTELSSMTLYPWLPNLVFGGRLQYYAVLEKAPAP